MMYNLNIRCKTHMDTIDVRKGEHKFELIHWANLWITASQIVWSAILFFMF